MDHKKFRLLEPIFFRSYPSHYRTFFIHFFKIILHYKSEIMLLYTCFVLMVVIRQAIASVYSIESANEEEYSAFLAMIDHQSKQDESRTRKYVYRPDPSTIDLSLYSQDRHGQFYLKCVDFNSTEPHKPMNLRCPMRHAQSRPACSLTYDYTNKVTIQGCYDQPHFDTETCSNNCNLQLTKHSAEGFQDKNYLVGFCCCKTPLCNSVDPTDIEKARLKYTEKHHNHHHKHHNSQVSNTPMSFWDRIRNF